MSEAVQPTLATLKASVDAKDWVAVKAQADALIARGQVPWQVWVYRAFAHNHARDLTATLADYMCALELAPTQAMVLNNAASVHIQRGEMAQAVGLYARAIEANPQLAYLRANLGLALKTMDRHAEASEAFLQALSMGHGDANLRMDAAQALQSAERPTEALAQYDAVIAAQPDNARAFNNRSAVRLSLGEVQLAIEDAEQALALKPDYAYAAMGLGNAHMAKEAYPEAIAAFDQALALDPRMAAVRNNRGNAHRALGDLDAACRDYAQAAQQQPDQVEYVMGWAAALGELSDHAQATQVLEQAIARQPSNAVLHFAQGLNLLARAQWPWGWFHFEFRYGAPEGFAMPHRTQLPAWRPESLAKRVLVTTEWALGDQVMFGAMLGDVQARWGLDLTVALDPRLLNLMGAAYPNIHFVSKRETPGDAGFEAHVSLISLGQFVRQSDADFVSAATGYLCADATRTADLRAALLGTRQRLVGISWRSLREGAEKRNIDLAELLRELARLDVALVSLQYGDVSEDIAEAVAATGVQLQTCDSVDNRDDIDGLAALISACDAVVSIDNTTVHLAGALGVPTWVMLQRKPDWRWMHPPLQQPWYDSVHPVRQTQDAHWSPVLAQVVGELANAWSQSSAL